MTLKRQVKQLSDSAIVYDAQLLSQISATEFGPEHWPSAEFIAGVGRGETLLIELAGMDCVLRHYYRGGVPGRFLNDQYLWTGQERVRSIREWDLLQEIAEAGLPAPIAVAARYVRRGIWYTADLITRKIPDVTPFSHWLEQEEKDPRIWAVVGRCIAEFHAAGFCHADLNAHNLQIANDGRVYLLDWDRGERRAPGKWRSSNLARLHRSCQKISGSGRVQFTPREWVDLINGYSNV
jgi:3-deoxy-D-manno-octulosonic acid kinase